MTYLAIAKTLKMILSHTLRVWWLAQNNPKGIMKTISLNCRGCNNEYTILHLLNLIKIENHNILFLLETKIFDVHMMTIPLILKFQNSHFIWLCNKAGGLALLWNNFVAITIISYCKYLINTFVTCMPDNSAWRASFVYKSPYNHKKAQSWDLLSKQTTPLPPS